MALRQELLHTGLMETCWLSLQVLWQIAQVKYIKMECRPVMLKLWKATTSNIYQKTKKIIEAIKWIRQSKNEVFYVNHLSILNIFQKNKLELNNTKGFEVISKWLAAKDFIPFAFQEETWQHIINNKSGLVNAPTGCGKTFSVFLGAIISFINQQS